ncbi:MAG: RNA 2',3'-cyclic phosphodiesterase [Chloroflexi bacterium]|nr:RNA 2',3'-cyclic phosphodiesterase [Chloroflexota bacterium]
MEQVRTFIAIELDEKIKAGLTELQEQLKVRVPQGSVRWVGPEGIHLTLKFLGNVPANRIEQIERAIAQACAGFSSFPFSVGGLGCFPDARRPRVVWVGVQEERGTLKRLQKVIEDGMEKLGFAPEGRGFQAHLTLGRTQRRASSSDVRRLGQVVEETDIGELGQMEARAVSLIKSDLRPTGAVYTRLAEVKLEG